MSLDTNRLVRLIKQAAVEAIDAHDPMALKIGEVVSASPLKIQINQKITIPASQLLLTNAVRNYTATLGVDNNETQNTEFSNVIDSAVNWAVSIANDNTHGYDQASRWGPDYDCSSLVISAYNQAGVGVKAAGATYTGNMKNAFLSCGFLDVTNSITLSNGRGLKKGDVLLNTSHHTALVVTDGGSTIVNASINEKGKTSGGKTGDQTGKEIYVRGYYNYPWNSVLRYSAQGPTPSADKLLLKMSLKVGERVLLLRCDGGQKFIVLDRLEAP